MSVQLQLRLFDETAEEKFRAFHRRHPEVYEELRRRAFEAKASLERHGRRSRCGIRMLWERMRWWFVIEIDHDEDFKLNDHYTAYYARLLMEQEPRLAGFFETRERK